MQIKTLRLLVMAASLYAGSCVAQSSEAGFYFGVGAGQSNYSINLDQQIRSAYQGNDNFSVMSTQVTDKADSAYKVTAGYRFLPWLSIEAAWVDLGHARTNYQLMNIKPNTFTSSVYAQDEYRVRGISLALNGEYALSDRFAALFRVGAIDSRLDFEENGTWVPASAGSPYQFNAATKNQIGPLAGLGLN